MINLSRILKIFVSASFLLSLAIMSGRVAGFFREIILGSTLGVTKESDAAVLLLTLPDLLVNIFLMGGLSVALMPIFKSEDHIKSKLVFNKIACFILLFFSFVSLAIYCYPTIFFKIIAPGFDASIFKMDFYFLLVCFSIILTALSGLTTVFLNSKNIFFIPGSGTLIFNTSVITLLIFNEFFNGFHGVALGIFLGALIRFLLQLNGIPLSASLLIQSIKTRLPNGLVRDFIFGFLSMSFIAIIPIIMRSYASLFGEGYLSLVNYVFKLIELPLTVLIVSLITVAYPKLSEYANHGDKDSASNTLLTLLKKIIFLSCTIVTVGFFYGYQAFDLLFNNGRISQENILRMVELFHLGILSIPFFGISYGLIAFLNSQKRSFYVLFSNVIAICFFLITCILSQLMQSIFLLMFSLISFSFVLMLILFLEVYKNLNLGIKLNLKRFLYILAASFSLIVIFKFLLFYTEVGNTLFQLIAASAVFLLVLIWGMNEIAK